MLLLCVRECNVGLTSALDIQYYRTQNVHTSLFVLLFLSLHHIQCRLDLSLYISECILWALAYVTDLFLYVLICRLRYFSYVPAKHWAAEDEKKVLLCAARASNYKLLQKHAHLLTLCHDSENAYRRISRSRVSIQWILCWCRLCARSFTRTPIDTIWQMAWFHLFVFRINSRFFNVMFQCIECRNASN